MHIHPNETELTTFQILIAGAASSADILDRIATNVRRTFTQVHAAEGILRSKSLKITAYFGELTGRELEVAKSLLTARIINLANKEAHAHSDELGLLVKK